MTNPALQETIIRTMKDTPERLRNICDSKVLEAFFEKGNYLIMRIVPSGDTRFYLESGKRITSIMDFLKPLQKQGMYFDGYGVNAGKKSKIKPPPPVPEVVSTMTEEVCTLFGKELMTDFYAAGFYLTIKGVSRKKKAQQWYLPNGRHINCKNDIVCFMVEKLRSPFTQEFYDKLMDDAAEALPGVTRDEVSVSSSNDEKNAYLILTIDGATTREQISQHVSYKGIVSKQLFNSLYMKSTTLQKRNAKAFADSHDLEALENIAKEILGDVQNRSVLTIGKYQIPSVTVTDIKVRTEPTKIQKATLYSTIAFNDGSERTFALEVPFGFTDSELQERYRDDIQHNVVPAIAEQKRYAVVQGSPIHDFVLNACKAKEPVAKTYAKDGIALNGSILTSYKALDEAQAYTVSNPIFAGKNKETAYLEVADIVTIRIDANGQLFECVNLTYSPLAEFLDISAGWMLDRLYEHDSSAKCSIEYRIVFDSENRGKDSLRCDAKLIDASTGAEIAKMYRCLDKRLKTDIETSKTRIPLSCCTMLYSAGSDDIACYLTVNGANSINATYEQIKAQFGSLGYQFCAFFGNLTNYRYSRTDLYTKFGESCKTEYKKGAAQEKLDSFLRMKLNLADNTCISLFRTDMVKNYYGYFEVFWPSSPYLMRVVAAMYKNDSADAMQPSLEDFEYLTKDAQYRILTEKCKTARTEEEAFAVISCLETQPQTVRKQLFTQEYFRDVYMLLNDADRMFADILISDCAGCVKLLKSLQKEVEEKA
jgi:hypothetical protein